MADDHLSVPELSRIIRLDGLGPSGTVQEIDADAGARAALAARFGLVSIDSLRATVRLKPLRGGAELRFSARIQAEIVQTCVATLDPVAEQIDETVEIVFERVDAAADRREVVVDVERDTEPLSGDTLDIGEIVAEELALSLNPYPRKPGAEPDGDAAPGPGPRNPFAALAALKRNE